MNNNDTSVKLYINAKLKSISGVRQLEVKSNAWIDRTSAPLITRCRLTSSVNVYICNHHTDKYFNDHFFANLIGKCLYLQSSCMYRKVFQSPCRKLFANLAGECLYLQALYRKVVSITLQKSILITMQKRLTLTLFAR